MKNKRAIAPKKIGAGREIPEAKDRTNPFVKEALN